MIIPTGVPRLDAAIRAEAEALARDLFDCFPKHATYIVKNGMRQQSGTWEEQSDEWRAMLIYGQTRLLGDLTRPASMDAAARRLAQPCGLECGATAPGWRMVAQGWLLYTSGGGERLFADADGYEPISFTKAPGISALTDPDAAMSAALVSVFEAAALVVALETP